MRFFMGICLWNACHFGDFVDNSGAETGKRMKYVQKSGRQ
jgi:hypothetical protein